ncbi:cysteine hydrolase [Pseudomonas chengduensis]|nr:cysteine hydrolase [Pseudomonas chengduensis]MDH1866519.1 cysteine hydrolase [Pseudomonas chengduensis]
MSHAALREWIAPVRTALCIIDYQVDFAAPDGLLGRMGVPVADVSCVEAPIHRLIDAARAAAVPIVFVGLRTAPETDSAVWREWMLRTGQNPDDSYAICRAGSGGEAFFRIEPQADDWVVWKERYSAFVGTDFEQQLRARGIDTLVLCGITTECCVDSTARDAFHRDFAVFLAQDACAAYEQDIHESTLKILSMSFAIPVASGDVAQAWRG